MWREAQAAQEAGTLLNFSRKYINLYNSLKFIEKKQISHYFVAQTKFL